MAIPAHDARGNLPPGDHSATLAEVETHFATNIRRRQIFEGLTWVVSRLVEHRVSAVYIDGSYVTTKIRPSDVDVVFVPPPTADTETWGVLAFSQRHRLKDLHKVDLWPWPSPQPDTSAATGLQTIRQFFTSDRDDYDKGLIVLEGITR